MWMLAGRSTSAKKNWRPNGISSANVNGVWIQKMIVSRLSGFSPDINCYISIIIQIFLRCPNGQCDEALITAEDWVPKDITCPKCATVADIALVILFLI